MLAEAKKRLGEDSFSYIQQNAEELTFKSNSFDWVVSHFMLYHVKNPELAFKEVARVLRPEGSFGIVLPTRTKASGDKSYSAEISLAFKILPELEAVYLRTSTISFYSNEAEVLLNKYFKEVKALPQPNTLFLDNVDLILGSVLSLPAFKTELVTDAFLKEYKEALSSLIESEGPIAKDSTITLLSGTHPLCG